MNNRDIDKAFLGLNKSLNELFTDLSHVKIQLQITEQELKSLKDENNRSYFENLIKEGINKDEKFQFKSVEDIINCFENFKKMHLDKIEIYNELIVEKRKELEEWQTIKAIQEQKEA